MAEKNISIGVDIGGTHITCGAVILREGKLLEHTLSRETFNHEDVAAHILPRWAAALNNTLSKTDLAEVAGIGFAIPGPFDYRNGISKMQHKFKNLFDIHIPTALNPLLTAAHDLPMRFLNDASAFAVGEAWLGEGRGFQKVVVITLGTGFGSAFIDGGVPVVAREDVPKEGCLWHLPFRDGIADDYFSTRWFTGAYHRETGETVSGVKELMEKSETDAFARGLFAQFGQNLAACLAPVLQKFGAEILIIGGNIAHARPLFEVRLRAGLQEAGVSIRLAPSRMEEHAALIGSARLLEERFWERVSAELPAI